MTGTVESIPLIASSIMSKKIAEGTSALVLDVKVGSGAFMKDVGSARAAGRDHGAARERRRACRTTAVLSRMDTPLGRACGNALEVAESVEVLAGGGPADVVELTVALAREMLALVGLGRRRPGRGPGRPATRCRCGGRWCAAQGGDPDAAAAGQQADPRACGPSGPGYVTRLDALAVGLAAWRLGAGRARKEDPVSPSAGVVCLAKEGDAVEEGQPVLELHVDDPVPPRGRRWRRWRAPSRSAPSRLEPEPLVIDVLRP